MTAYTISFYEKIKLEELEVENTYSKVWSVLQEAYGNPINKDGKGSCFRGKNGETAVLTDRGRESEIHEIVLVDVPTDIAKQLEGIVNNKD